jgi:hypothetical protein
MAKGIDLERRRAELGASPEALQNFWVTSAGGFVGHVGDELERIERKIKDQFPAVTHVDLKVFWNQIIGQWQPGNR